MRALVIKEYSLLGPHSLSKQREKEINDANTKDTVLRIFIYILETPEREKQ